ncbi:hypothetical protein BESB_045910 [Besnoitia besnoiti]|uniref:Conserved oligomeric Golgi complex subunit 7 n=1 Tax=Besnoitia besnoiti TaxID=94643 RepID=A0A2A9MEV3_BESBE|nr:hypothetical protein BESB_045910 [Besnoitia besnoiti]PFH36399.1 hypothetical protein BESB_045910 [Besnoitia besnoiti]
MPTSAVTRASPSSSFPSSASASFPLSDAFHSLSDPGFSPGPWLDACIETGLQSRPDLYRPSSPDQQTAEEEAQRLQSTVGGLLADVQQRIATSFCALDVKSQDLSAAVPACVTEVANFEVKIERANGIVSDALDALTTIDAEHQESLRRLAALDALKQHFQRCRRVLLDLHQWDFRVGEIELLLHSFHQQTASPVASSSPSPVAELASPVGAGRVQQPREPAADAPPCTAPPSAASSTFEAAANIAHHRSLVQAAMHAAVLKNSVKEMKAFGEFAGRVRAAELLEKRVVAVARNLLKSSFLACDPAGLRVATEVFLTLQRAAQLPEELPKSLAEQLRRVWRALWARTPSGRGAALGLEGTVGPWAPEPLEAGDGGAGTALAGETAEDANGGSGYYTGGGQDSDYGHDGLARPNRAAPIGETDALLFYFEEFAKVLEERASLLRRFADELSQAELRAAHAPPQGVSSAPVAFPMGAPAPVRHRLRRTASLSQARCWEDLLLRSLKAGSEVPSEELEVFLLAATRLGRGAEEEFEGEEAERERAGRNLQLLERMLQTYETCVTLLCATPVVGESEPHTPHLWQKLPSNCLFFPPVLLREYNAALARSLRAALMEEAASVKQLDRRQAPSQVVIELEGRLDRSFQRLADASLACFSGVASQAALAPCLLASADGALAEFLSSLSPVLQTFAHTIHHKAKTLQAEQDVSRGGRAGTRVSEPFPDLLPSCVPFEAPLLNACLQQLLVLASLQQKLAQGAATIFARAAAAYRRSGRFNTYLRGLVDLHPDLLVYPSPEAVAQSTALLAAASASPPRFDAVFPASASIYEALLHASRALVLLACAVPFALFLRRFYRPALASQRAAVTREAAGFADDARERLPSTVITTAGEFFLQLLPQLDVATASPLEPASGGGEGREAGPEKASSRAEPLIAGLLSAASTAFCRVLLELDFSFSPSAGGKPAHGSHSARGREPSGDKLDGGALLQLQSDARYLVSLSSSLGYDSTADLACLLAQEEEETDRGAEEEDAARADGSRQADTPKAQERAEGAGMSAADAYSAESEQEKNDLCCDKEENGRRRDAPVQKGPSWMVELLLLGLDALVEQDRRGHGESASDCEKGDTRQPSGSSASILAAFHRQAKRTLLKNAAKVKQEGEKENLNSPSEAALEAAGALSARAEATVALDSPASDLWRSLAEKDDEECLLIWALLHKLGVFARDTA